MNSPGLLFPLPSPEDIDFCLNVLRRLKPGDLGSLPKEFTAAGHALFKKSIKLELFGENDVVSFLKQKEDYRTLLKRLEKVHSEVERSHAQYVEAASCAGINSMRQAKTAEVNSTGVAALTTQAGLLNLLENLMTSSPLDGGPLLLEMSGSSTVPDDTGEHKTSLLADSKDREPDDGAVTSSVQERREDPDADNLIQLGESEEGGGNGSNVAAEVTKPSANSKQLAVGVEDHYRSGSDFRAGGLGRSRGRRAVFNIDRVRGMYEDEDCEIGLEEAGDGGEQPSDPTKVRRRGIIYLIPRSENQNTQHEQPSASDSSSVNISAAIVPRDRGDMDMASMMKKSKTGVDIAGLGMLCYVVDDQDGTKRACALRTIVEISKALVGVGVTVTGYAVCSHPCTYVVGKRKQRWALLGGAIDDLSGETAISVRLYIPTSDSDSAACPGGSASAPDDASQTIPSSVSAKSAGDADSDFVVPPIGSFRKHCNVCKQPYTMLHSFYHQLCPRCGDFNLEKRLQTSDLRGYVCVVTGGRVRIGYQICLKLLRAGATVVVTTRWAGDAALRYSQEADFSRWKDRLMVDELEMSDIAAVEAYCNYLIKRFKRIHVLINNAAQTLTRPEGWAGKMRGVDKNAQLLLPPAAESVLQTPWMALTWRPDTGNANHPDKIKQQGDNDNCDSNAGRAYTKPTSPCNWDDIDTDTRKMPPETPDLGSEPEPEADTRTATSKAPVNISASADISKLHSLDGSWVTTELDESGQPLDRSGVNSWSRRLSEVGTVEMAQTMAVNAIAPFVLCSRLKDVMMPFKLRSKEGPMSNTGGRGDDCNINSSTAKHAFTEANTGDCSSVDPPYSHIVNVTALEGKFNVGKKSGGHPHTNMAKAALNMMTLTGARDYARDGILMNSVDTGWVTDMSPGGLGATAAKHETFVGPPLDDEDGAARVLDPVFSHVNGGGVDKKCGNFYKDYLKASW